jgi:hypothetical protein
LGNLNLSLPRTTGKKFPPNNALYLLTYDSVTSEGLMFFAGEVSVFSTILFLLNSPELSVAVRARVDLFDIS